ncbi:MAG: hypothetical protein C0478_10800 [Planctomyces sp.]|nr:hypothetical protein [Planctomyces sp.]
MTEGLHHATTLIIPVHGQIDRLRACIATLRRWHPVPILLIDDGNPTGSLASCKSLPGVRVLHQPHRGVTRAWNTGLSAARTKFVVLLNSDVTSTGPWLDSLLTPLRHSPDVLLTGAAWQSPAATHAIGQPEHSLLAGWCLAFRRSLWNDCGPFDERFHHWFSDTDFQHRVRQFAAALPTPAPDPIRCVSDLPLEHAGHASTRQLPDRQALHAADRLAYLDKWPPK